MVNFPFTSKVRQYPCSVNILVAPKNVIGNARLYFSNLLNR